MSNFVPRQWKCAVPGCVGLDSTGYGHFCHHHACKRAACPKPRAEGTGYCAVHACDLVSCTKSRLDTSAFCNQHACQYSGCTACKRGVGSDEGAHGEACDDHTCQAELCPHARRFQRPYCRAHSCRWSGRLPCNQPVPIGALACRDHACQYEGGCADVRRVKSNSEACDEHNCAHKGCYRAVGVRGKYCAEHTCVWDPCSKKGGAGGSPFCESHKCEAKGCPAPVMSKLDWFCEHHKCRYAGSACGGGWSDEPPYCKDHTCGHDGCNAPVRRGGQFCIPHTCAMRINGQPCTRGRKGGSQMCGEHACTKCTEPRESNSSRCAAHQKDDMYYMYAPRGEKKRSKKKPHSPRGSSSSLDERDRDVQVRKADSRERRAKSPVPTAKAAPRAKKHLPPEDVMELQLAKGHRGNIVGAIGGKGQLSLIPPSFKSDRKQAIAYGCGFRDACLHMAGMMSNQMDMIRPLSPTRHVAHIEGPRFSALDDGDEL